MMVTILSHNTFLIGRSLLLDIPLDNVTRLGGTNYNVWLEWVEHCFCHLVLAGQGVFWTTLETERKDINQTIWLIISELAAFTVADKDKLSFL